MVVVAAATAPGRSALAVIRVGGAGSDDVVRRFCTPLSGWPVPPGRLRRIIVHDRHGRFDDGVLAFWRGPRSPTGEDLYELSLHGNPLIVERAVLAAVDAGARVAPPGEFTRRALHHGKIDLVGAEAVLQLAEATSARGLDVARAGVDGRLFAAFAALRAPLVEAAADLEARLDYPADELAYLDDAALLSSLGTIAASPRSLADTWSIGRALVAGARVALVGAVIAGKSSLFNALLGDQRALVHQTPGTTRDVLEVVTRFGDLQVTLLDTAGERPTEDPVEAAGQALAHRLVGAADLVVVVLRSKTGVTPDPVEAEILRCTAGPRIVAYNGVDRHESPPPPGALPVSALTGEGVAELRLAIVDRLVGQELSSIIASARQRDLLLAVAAAADEAIGALAVAEPAVAVDAVVRAIEEIDALTGADTREGILDALFARFCIGK
jgi:tRNA modification GTPase